MKKILILIAIILFPISVFAQENYCLNHIEDHIFQYGPDEYELDLTNCQLQDTDLVAVSDVIKTHTGIDVLTFDKNNIGEKGIQALNGLERISDMSIDDNQIGDNGLKLLLNKAYNLSQFSVNRNKITNQSVSLLAQSNIALLHLAGNQITNAAPLANKVKLDLNFNPLSSDSLLKLAQSTSLDTLYIAGTHLNETILKALRDNQSIEELNISQTNLGDQGIKILSDNLGLVILQADKNKITDEGIQQGITKLRGLRYLILNDNNITAAGIKALPYDRLELLDLSNNHLGDKGVQALSGDRIQYLYLDNNQIQSKESARYIANNLPHLSILSINDNDLGLDGVKELVKHTFGGIFMDNNHIGNEGALILAQNVGSLISMANNNIDDQGVLKFEPLLDKRLFYLDVRKNHIGPVGIQTLKNHQPPINHLYIDEPKSLVTKNEKCDFLTR